MGEDMAEICPPMRSVPLRKRHGCQEFLAHFHVTTAQTGVLSAAETPAPYS